MKCIIRIHHDTDWLRNSDITNVKYLTLMKYKALIDLFVDEFGYMSNDVLFEACNEWGFEIVEYDDPLLLLNEDNIDELKKKLYFQCLTYFRNAVRAVNPERILLIPGIYHDAGYTSKFANVYASLLDDHSYLSIHWYEPKVFTLSANDSEPESTKSDDLDLFNAEALSCLESLCEKYPVLISEYGCTMAGHSDSSIYEWFQWCKTVFDRLGIDRAVWMEKPGKSVIDRETLQENVPGILDTLI